VSVEAELAARAAARFPRWDGALFAEIVAGPAQELARGLIGSGAPEAEDAARVYLELACEAVGLGYLYPASAGRESFFTHAFCTLLPRELPRLPPARWGETLATCWNLGENLEASPAWLRRLVTRQTRQLTSLDALPGLIEETSRQIFAPPAVKLEGLARQVWLAPSEEDRRFLPGAMHFVAPLVLCVHDRLRTGGGGREAAAIGVWLGEPPLLLGPMACGEQPPVEVRETDVARGTIAADPRITEPYALAQNEWRAALAQVTSQFLVAVFPA
jgi:hypothetical protein